VTTGSLVALRKYSQALRAVDLGGDQERAIALLEKYNAAEGRQAWGYAHLGRAYALAGDLERAEAAYREAMAMDPRDPGSPWT
jgi:predicted Zn-dependent protease